MKDSNKVTLTLGQLKKLVREGRTYDPNLKTSWTNHKSSKEMRNYLEKILHDNFEIVEILDNGQLAVFDRELGNWEILFRPTDG